MLAAPNSTHHHAADMAASASAVNDQASFFRMPEWFDVLDRYGLPPDTARDAAQADDAVRLPLLHSGHRFSALANYYSADFGPINASACTASHATQLAKYFRSQRATHISLQPIREDAAWLPLLMDALRGQHYLCDTFEVSTNWYLPCAGLSWADYLAARPSRLRNTFRRCRKKLEQEAGFRIEILSSDDERLDVALDAYARVYAQSWKEAEPYPHFIPALCRMAAARGWLRLGVLWLNGQAAAAQIWFVKDETASIYKLAYDGRLAKLGVGTVLTAALAEHVLDADHVQEIDFLTGDDSYKAEWMSHSRKLVGMLAYDSRSVSGLLGAVRHFGGRWVKKVVISK